MMPPIQKYLRTSSNDFKFSIIIPTWNNIRYLQLCIRSLQQHSAFKHQIIVLVNEGKDGTLQWLNTQHDIDFVHAETNIGICMGLNICRELVKSDYILYANDDMYFLPNWDSALADSIQNIHTQYFMFSSTMIEPSGNNPCCVIADYGNSVDNFRENDLMSDFGSLTRDNWSGSTWPPNLIPKDLWDLVGGMSVEYSPGMYSDPDFSRKLWMVGVRHFEGIGQSLVYHFGSKSTRKLKKNSGRTIFLQKWHISAHTFMHTFLHIGQKTPMPLPEVKLSVTQRFINHCKFILSTFKGS
ncbi:MAG: glycosyltransferase [Bacteroidales bacterium]|nr:glycosyltransferase [Bacteroidales bacterium]MDD4394573.1 glycosyltransferase [Bacteroidales bacterium]